MQVSQKSRTFAPVIELNRHIEILLLSSDCVIVPDLGGFVTHHVDARYDDNDKMFVPPLRTLGFNPQLTLNDLLLAQSYIEAYDIDYPEALRRIEAEVAELKQHLNDEGFYEMNGIGVLSLNDEGRIVFEPCEAGLLTPALYGLSAFEMLPLQGSKSTLAATSAKRAQPVLASTTEQEGEPTTNQERAIIIKMSWLRNIAAVAAAVLAFFLITPPVANGDQQDTQQLTMSQIELLPLPKKAEPKKIEQKVADSAIIANENRDTLEATPLEVKEVKPEKVEQKQEEPIVAKEPAYCLVLASQVAKQGAENLVSQMKQRGYDDTRIDIHNNIRRVVYGRFETLDEAHLALNKLRSTATGFDEAWVYKTN